MIGAAVAVLVLMGATLGGLAGFSAALLLCSRRGQ